MKAVAVVPGTNHSLHVRTDVPEPRPEAHEAVVRVLEAGLCGTDREIAEGLFGQAPAGSPYLVLGHENLGVVEQTPARSGLARGDLVVATVRRGCPQACRACISDQADMCLTGDYLERGIKGLHGYMVERYAESPRYLVRLAPALRQVGVLLEPMSIVQKGVEHALRILLRLTWAPRKALVVGAGPIGLLAALALRLRGLEVHVAALEPETSPRAALLAEIGANYASTVTTPLAAAAERAGWIDLVFEATGSPQVVMPAIGALGPNGVAVLSGVTLGRYEIAFDVADWNREIMMKNRVVLGTVNAGRRHFESGARDLEAAQARFSGWLGRLVTGRHPVSEAAQAIERRPSDVKTVIEFS